MPYVNMFLQYFVNICQRRRMQPKPVAIRRVPRRKWGAFHLAGGVPVAQHFTHIAVWYLAALPVLAVMLAAPLVQVARRVIRRTFAALPHAAPRVGTEEVIGRWDEF